MSSCAAAVARVAVLLLTLGRKPCSSDTAAYCRARAKLPEVKAELPIDGKINWTYVSFEADFPRQCYNWALRIDAAGEGAVWVDDMDVTPLAGK